MINLNILNKKIYIICFKSFSSKCNNYRSFIKDLFVCRLNIDLLDYPELSNKDKVKETSDISERLKQMMLEDKGEYFSIFNHNLQPMQRCKLAELFESQKYSSCLSFVHKSAVTEAIHMWGDVAKKMKYLPLLKKDCTHGVILCSQLQDSFGTSTVVSGDGSKYILNGTHTKVTYLPQSSLILVTAFLNAPQVFQDTKTAFIIDSNSVGVSITDEGRTLQLRDVMVPSDNVLGSIGCGEKILRRAMTTQSLMLSSICCGRLKSLLSQCTKYANDRHVFGVPLTSYEKVQMKLVSMCTDIFLAESMIYFVAGNIDDTRDWLTEGLATQVFCQEALKRAIDQMMQFYSHNGFRLDSFESTINNTLDLSRYQLCSKSDKEMITRECLQHFLNNYSEIGDSWINDIGCKLGIVPDIRFYTQNDQRKSSIASHFHPSVAFLAQHFFIDLRKIAVRINSIRNTHGKNLLLDNNFLMDFSDWIIDLWPIIVALSRVNRAHCLELPSHKHQMNVLTTHLSKVHFSLDRKLLYKNMIPKVEVDLLNLSKSSSCSRNGLPHPIDI